MLQAPEAFGFKSDLLLCIAEHCYSGWFGTFLCNCERERTMADQFGNAKLEPLSQTSVSLWDYVMQHRKIFDSGRAVRGGVLLPRVENNQIQLWAGMFRRSTLPELVAQREFRQVDSINRCGWAINRMESRQVHLG
jgi:hypothetical protein